MLMSKEMLFDKGYIAYDNTRNSSLFVYVYEIQFE